MREPDEVFGRDREWQGFARFATSSSPDARLTVVSGRRRQGKSYLLNVVAEQVGGFFHTVIDSTRTEALARFGQELAASTGGGRYAFADWGEALDRLFAVVTDGLIVIDEFPTSARPRRRCRR